MTSNANDIQKPKRPRLYSLDQARAIAVAAMLLAHFGPGLIERLPVSSETGARILTLGRMATPAFAAIFGITIGFIYLPAIARDGGRKARTSLLKRSMVVAFCALIVAVPELVKIPSSERTFGRALIGTYSVLSFYAYALVILPLILPWIARRPAINAPLLGLASWAICLVLRNFVWPEPEVHGVEQYFRLTLISGRYGFFLMMGTILALMPLGIQLHRMTKFGEERRTLVALSTVGGVGVALALVRYALVSEDTAAFFYNIQTDRLGLWNHVLFGSLAVLLIWVFSVLNQSLPGWMSLGYPLALAGQASLMIYTTHAFVLPALHLTDLVYKIEGPLRSVFPMLLFGAVFLYIVYRRSLVVPPPPRRTLSQAFAAVEPVANA